MRPRARRRAAWRALALIAISALAILALDWDLSALSSPQERARALARMGTFLSAFGAPDLSREALSQALSLSISTLSIALWGTALAVALGWTLGIVASRAVMLDGDPPARWGGAGRLSRRLALEAARVVLDVLRGIPDFAWALLILTLPGPGPVTGILAVGVSTGGILGKIYSELWDALEPRRVEPLRASGAGRLSVFLYGLQPMAARSMLSFTLMRWECAVRNASVIGVVGGGGLGAELFDELSYGHHARVVTLLCALLALTATTDLFSGFLRRALSDDPNHPRQARALDLRSAARRRALALSSLAALLAASLAWLEPAFARAWGELERIEWAWIGEQLSALLRPDLSAPALREALSQARVPLALGLLGTLGAYGAAAALAYPGSVAFQLEPERFSGERVAPLARALRGGRLVAARTLALLARAVPEVAWVLLLSTALHLGTLAGVLAIALHSSGVLARVFVETVDNLPYRRLEPAFQGSRLATFLYAAVPPSLGSWLTYALFQLEVNVRMSLVLGVLGLGGLGDRFHTAVTFWNLRRAGTFLIAMVLLTVLIDRLSRARTSRA